MAKLINYNNRNSKTVHCGGSDICTAIA